MSTVFSHIVQKHLSQNYENVSTDALAFILSSSNGARRGMMRLLRSLVPDIQELQFRTQLTEGSSRPDMWGMDGSTSRVFVENKFWAGLTDNQPVSYLRILAESDSNGILLFVAPTAREDFLWRELNNRLREAAIGTDGIAAAAGVPFAARTSSGPLIALTSWDRLIAMIELEIADDSEALANVHQLRALCKAADGDAFIPFSPEEISDQRIPSMILQAGTVIKKALKKAESAGIVNKVDKRSETARWDRIGHYCMFSDANGYENGFGAFFGVELDLWRRHGETPLWVTFYEPDNRALRRAAEARAFFEPEADKHNIFTSMETKEFAIAIKVPTGEEMDVIIRSVVDQLRFISQILAQAPPP